MYENNQGQYRSPVPFPQPIYQQPYYPQPVNYAPVPVQENGIPITPIYEEKKWIKRFYNWVGGCLLIHFGMATILSAIIMTAYVVISLSSIANSGSVTDFSKEFKSGSNSYAFITMLATAIAYGIANLSVFWIGCANTKMKAKELFKFNGFSAKLVLGAIAIGLGIQTVVSALADVMMYFLDKSGIDISSLFQASTNDKPTLIVTILYTCIIAPITEELVFRGLCLKNLSRFNQRFGIFASAILFGLVHGNIIQFCLASTLGIVLAYITIKANSIIPAMIVHFTVNTTSTIRDMVNTAYEQYATSLNIGWYIVTFVAGAVVLIVALKKYKVRLPKQTVPQKKRGLPIFMSSVPLVIIASLYAAMIILPLQILPLILLIKK